MLLRNKYFPTELERVGLTRGKIIITGVKRLSVGLALGNLKLAGLKSGFVVPSQENPSANVYDILSFLPSVPSSLMK